MAAAATLQVTKASTAAIEKTAELVRPSVPLSVTGGPAGKFRWPPCPPAGNGAGAGNNVPMPIERNAADRKHLNIQIEVFATAGRIVILRNIYFDDPDTGRQLATAIVHWVAPRACGEPSDFANSISSDHPAIFRLADTTRDRNCRWRIALEWASGGATGITYLNETFHATNRRHMSRREDTETPP